MGAFDMIKSKNKDDDEAKEDPIQKAEREFFEIIKKVFLLSLPFTYICTLYPYIIVKIHFSQEQEKRIAAKKESLGKSAEIEDQVSFT